MLVNIPKTFVQLLASALCLNLIDASFNMSTMHPKFADGLTALMYTDGENECSSSLGVSMAFSLVYPGSTGESAVQIRNVLEYPSDLSPFDQPIWEKTTERLSSSYNGGCAYQIGPGESCYSQKPILQVAYSIWIDDEFMLASDYQSVVGSYVRQLDFEDENSPAIINDWVSNSTNGLIDSIMEEGKKIDYKMIAINTIYMKASWRSSFSKAHTNVDTFYATPSRDSVVGQAHFMHQKFRNLMYSEDLLPGFQVVQLPFAESTLSMIIVLPVSENSTTATSVDVLPILQDLESKPVVLALPKFKFESEYSDGLKQALETLGMTAPFDPNGPNGGDLCNITGTCNLYIEKIIQKTVIDLNEDGVEAAAVTAIMISPTSVVIDPPEFSLVMADHPFQFFLYDETEDLIFFEGQVGNPGISSESDPPQLQLVHSESTFWSDTFGVDKIIKPSLPLPVSDTESVTTVLKPSLDKESTGDPKPGTEVSSVDDSTSDAGTTTIPPASISDKTTASPTLVSDEKTDPPTSTTDISAAGSTLSLYVFPIFSLSWAISLFLLQ